MRTKPGIVFFLTVLISIILIFSIHSEKPVQADTKTVPGFACYRHIDEIFTSINRLAQIYPDLSETIDIGDSWEKVHLEGSNGHDILVLKLGNRSIPGSKPYLVLVSGLRANAFGAVELNLRFAEFLLNNYQNDEDVHFILNHVDIHFIMLANPDGRVRAEAQADGSGEGQIISWAKNANTIGCQSEEKGGVSLQRNFIYQWNNYASDPCDEDYSGESPASEPETIAIQAYLRDLKDSNPSSGLLIDLETFGNQVITPYLYSKSHLPRFFNAYQILANKLAYGNESVPYPGNDADIDEINGSLLDFAEGELSMAAIQHLLGSHRAGNYVANCAYFEEYIGQDVIQSLLRAAKSAAAPFEYPAGPEVVEFKVEEQDDIFHVSGKLDALSFFHFTDRIVSIDSVHYTIDLPPWNPGASKIEIEDFERDLDFPGIATFEFTLDPKQFSPGKHDIYVQGVAYDAISDLKNAGFVVSFSFEVFDPLLNRYFPMLMMGN